VLCSIALNGFLSCLAEVADPSRLSEDRHWASGTPMGQSKSPLGPEHGLSREVTSLRDSPRRPSLPGTGVRGTGCPVPFDKLRAGSLGLLCCGPYDDTALAPTLERAYKAGRSTQGPMLAAARYSGTSVACSIQKLVCQQPVKLPLKTRTSSPGVPVENRGFDVLHAPLFARAATKPGEAPK
jgi:hypothetical protein